MRNQEFPISVTNISINFKLYAKITDGVNRGWIQLEQKKVIEKENSCYCRCMIQFWIFAVASRGFSDYLYENVPFLEDWWSRIPWTETYFIMQQNLISGRLIVFLVETLKLPAVGGNTN
jgi:hypothetical protein